MQWRLDWRPSPRLGWRPLRRLAEKMRLKARPAGAFRLMQGHRDVYFRHTLEEIEGLARDVIDPEPPIKKARSSLRKAAKKLTDAKSVVEGLPWRERAAFAAAVSREGLLGVDPNHLAGLAKAAESAASRVESQEARPGRLQKAARANFIDYLVERFELMGNEPGLTNNSSYRPETPFDGEVFAFVEECFELIGVTMPNKALGKAIQKSPAYEQARRRARERRAMEKKGV